MEWSQGAQDMQLDTPNIARMYDYFLGGSANFAVDRQAAEEFLKVYPGNTAYCQINRSFLGRAVRYLATEIGIDQFLDLGSGVPTVGNVHEIAQQQNPNARVAYVDVEPVAVHHARHLLNSDDRVSVTQADIRRPEDVLEAPTVASLLDFERPVAILAVAILDIIDAHDPAELMATYRDACVSGSALAISNGATLHMSHEEKRGAEDVMSKTTTPTVHWRNSDEVAALFPGYELIDPGVVPSAAWRPEKTVSTEEAMRSNAYAGVGLLP